MELSLAKASILQTTDERTTYIGFEFGHPLSIGSACTGGVGARYGVL
jgi:hypothetical protein